MKKVLCVLAAVAFVATISTSCKKDCTCTYPNGTSFTHSDIKKSECDKLNDTAKLVGAECK